MEDRYWGGKLFAEGNYSWYNEWYLNKMHVEINYGGMGVFWKILMREGSRFALRSFFFDLCRPFLMGNSTFSSLFFHLNFMHFISLSSDLISWLKFWEYFSFFLIYLLVVSWIWSFVQNKLNLSVFSWILSQIIQSW